MKVTQAIPTSPPVVIELTGDEAKILHRICMTNLSVPRTVADDAKASRLFCSSYTYDIVKYFVDDLREALEKGGIHG